MRRILAVTVLLALAAPAPAHFIWLVPEHDKASVLMVFSDTPEPDANVPVKKIAQTKLFARGGVKGEPLPVKIDEAKDAYRVTLEKEAEGPVMIAGVCHYGVATKAADAPYLLVYYPKTLLWRGGAGGAGAAVKQRPEWPFNGTEQLPLEIVPVFGGKAGGKTRGKVLWHGKPAAGVEVVLTYPGGKEPLEVKTDAEGMFAVPAPEAAGTYAGRARFVEKKEGELGGKKYTEIRHYATMTFEVRKQAAPAKDGGTSAVLFEGGEAKPAEDPAATKLLADARAARAVWKDFGGFTAEVTVNQDGVVHKGTVVVGGEGKVKLRLAAGDDLQTWTRREIASLVAHRLPLATSLQTPCAFADPGDEHHPLGRAVRVLNDELHSSYRIRDRQIIEVNRRTKDVRFTITVLDSMLTKERQFLPVSYVVDSWDPKTGQLAHSSAQHATWQRVGPYDLPRSLLVVTSTAAGRESRSITFDNLRLTKGTP